MSGVPDCLVRVIVVGKGTDWLAHAAIVGPRRIVTVLHVLEHRDGPIVVMDWERGFKWRGEKRQVVKGVASNGLADGAVVIDLRPPAGKSGWNYPEHCIAPVLAESAGYTTDADRAAWLLTARGLQHYPGPTRLGDSGAPCFDREMRVVGLRSHGGGSDGRGAFLPIRQREDGSIAVRQMLRVDGIEGSGKMPRVRGDR